MPLIGDVLKCDNDCSHGCDMPIDPERSFVQQALDGWWVVVLWKTPPGYAHAHAIDDGAPAHDHAHDAAGNDQHAMVFCDAFCAYNHQRGKLMRQPDYARRLFKMEHPDSDAPGDQRDRVRE